MEEGHRTVEAIGAGLGYTTCPQYPFVLTLGQVFCLFASSSFCAVSFAHVFHWVDSDCLWNLYQPDFTHVET